MLPWQDGAGAMSSYAERMRSGVRLGTDSHTYRMTPRDFGMFNRMQPGDEFPAAHAIAMPRAEEQSPTCTSTPQARTPARPRSRPPGR